MAPAYTQRLDLQPIPKFTMPVEGARPDAAYRLIHDELLLDGSSRLNLATFVTTWMEPEADQLMAEAFDKNMIDKDEYPQTAEIERRCVNMVAHLFNAAGNSDAVGTSTIGSSEAVMLAGLAMKWRWRARRAAAKAASDKPNLILGSNVQVVWEKFCRYWDVEPRYIPVQHGRYVVAPDEVVRGSTRTRSASSRSSAPRTPASSNRSRRSTTPSWPTTPPPGSTCRSTSTPPAAAS